MSLINDALKRAKQAQDNQPPPPLAGAPLHAAPDTPAARWVLPVIVLLVLGASGVAVLLWSEHGGKTKSASVSATAPPSAPATPVVAPAPAPAPKLSVPAEPATQGLAATETVPPTNAPEAPVVTPATPPQPPELKLQGILYRPDKPEAIINGRTMYVGSHLGEVEITRITQDEVTVVWRKQTILLKLE